MKQYMAKAGGLFLATVVLWAVSASAADSLEGAAPQAGRLSDFFAESPWSHLALVPEVPSPGVIEVAQKTTQIDVVPPVFLSIRGITALNDCGRQEGERFASIRIYRHRVQLVDSEPFLLRLGSRRRVTFLSRFSMDIPLGENDDLSRKAAVQFRLIPCNPARHQCAPGDVVLEVETFTGDQDASRPKEILVHRSQETNKKLISVSAQDVSRRLWRYRLDFQFDLWIARSVSDLPPTPPFSYGRKEDVCR